MQIAYYYLLLKEKSKVSETGACWNIKVKAISDQTPFRKYKFNTSLKYVGSLLPKLHFSLILIHFDFAPKATSNMVDDIW